MCAFGVLGLVFPYRAKRLVSGRLRNDLFCVERDVKPQSINYGSVLLARLATTQHFAIC